MERFTITPIKDKAIQYKYLKNDLFTILGYIYKFIYY